MVRQPDWSSDEWVIALEFYLRHRGDIPGNTSPEIKELSDTLRRLRQVFTPDPVKFRNPAGVYMQVMTFADIDLKGEGGLPSSALARRVWGEYFDHPDGKDQKQARNAVQMATEVIQAQAAQLATMDGMELAAILAGGGANVEGGIEEGRVATEGEVRWAFHAVRERSPSLVREKKKIYLEKYKKLPCEACAFQYRDRYGEYGADFIECHHITPLSELPPDTETRLDDLMLVCANCHRMIHHRRPWLGVEELRGILRVEG